MSNIEMEYSANTLLKKPHSVIQFDKTTRELKRPTLLLRKKNGEYICKLDYTNLKMSLVGKGLDEISFDVHKYVDGKKFPFWEQLTDLKTIEYVGYGCFETSVHINDAEETVKSCVAVSLECELGQLILREGHYNDDEDLLHAKESSPSRTVLYNEEDPDHSLLHRVLKDKAPHWNIGFVSPRLNVDGYVYESNHFQRTYTADGVSIYDFLTGEVAAESNCIFLFDTYRRTIHCVNIESCVYDTSTMKVVEGAYKKEGQYYDKTGALLKTKTLAYCEGIGQDTNILVSKQKLAQDFGVEFNKDSVKNCFYVTGGDDIINDLVAAANLSGDNYIYEFSKFQYDDMSEGLSNAIFEYKKNLKDNQERFYGRGGVYTVDCDGKYTYSNEICRDKDENIVTDFEYRNGKIYIKNPYAYRDENGTIRDENDKELPVDSYYYKDPGIYTNYCNLVTRRSYLKDSKFPDTPIRKTTAKDEYDKLKNSFSTDGIVVVVTQAISENDYTIALKNAKAYMETILDSRYTLAIKESSLKNGQGENRYILDTDICISRDTDEKDSHGSKESAPLLINIQKINILDTKQNADYIKQKLELKKASLDIADLDFRSDSMEELKNFFLQYNLTTLQGYVSNFKSCRDVLVDLSNGNIHAEGENANPTCDALYDKYEKYCMAAEKIQDFRESQIHMLDEKIADADENLKKFREDVSINNYIKDTQWEEFRSFVREDEYNNGNYISDGLSDSELIENANALLAAATKELQKACVLQRSVSVNLMNLFAIPEYRPLFHDFAIFNYIRVKVDDEIYKVRIVQLDFDENSPESIQVTFSEDVEYQDGTVSDLQDMRSQVAGITTSYNSTYRQAKQGADAQSTFQKIKEEGLLSSEFLIKNSNSEETVIDNTGILTRSMDDVDCYSDYQCKMIGKGLYLTSDNWKSVKAGIGLMQFNGKWQYGVIADTIVGNLIASNKVIIDNKAVTIDKNKNDTKRWNNRMGNPIELDNGETLPEFAKKTTEKLSTLNARIPLTEIGEDYVISPKIGGGYLYIQNNKYSVEIDPNAESNNTLHGYLFAIRHNSSETRIMSVDNMGNGYFKGQIETKNGNIGGWNITQNSITTDNSSGSSYIMTGNISFTSENDTGTRIGNGYILNGGKDGDNYKLAWIHNGAIDLYRQPYENSPYRMVMTSDILYGYNLKYATTPWFTLDNIERKLFIDGDISVCKPIYIENGKCLESSNCYGSVTHLIGASSGSSTIFIGNHDIHKHDTETICLNATNVYYTGNAPQAISSDRRIKSNITPIENSVELIKNLEPCQYNLADSTSERKHFGFIAQQVNDTLSKTTGDAGLFVKMPAEDGVEVDFDNEETYLCGLRYDEFIAPMVATIQDLYKQVDALKEEIKELKEKTTSKTK